MIAKMSVAKGIGGRVIKVAPYGVWVMCVGGDLPLAPCAGGCVGPLGTTTTCADGYKEGSRDDDRVSPAAEQAAVSGV